MLLHEQASVQTFWHHANPNLSWFDARQVLPLPAPGEEATYLIASSSPLNDESSKLLRQYGQEIDQVSAPGGSPALTAIRVSDTAGIALPSEEHKSADSILRKPGADGSCHRQHGHGRL